MENSLVNVPEHHEEAYIFFPVELATREQSCAVGVLCTFVCCMGAFAEDDSDGQRKVDIYS